MEARGHVPKVQGVDRPADRRAEVERAALELFASVGYRATRMSDVAQRLGIRGPSLYKHVTSKYELLTSIMTNTMQQLLEHQREALESTDDITEKLRRMVEAHVRFHARHHLEAFVGNREIENLHEPERADVLRSRARYELGLRNVIEAGAEHGSFVVSSAQLASYAIIDMGIGISLWYRADGLISENTVAFTYGDFALRVVGLGY